ncbi:MAG: septum site-determining protein MinC [Clostridia bacterium]|nr:septum site-determining protein MinC [Clostridia bacterium]
MEENAVAFKGSVNGLTIIMKDEYAFETILQHIDNKIAQAGKFFKGASLNVKYRGKKLSKDEEEKVLSLLVNKSGAKINNFEEDQEVQIQNDNTPKQTPQKMEIKKYYYFKDIYEGVTKFYRGTVRSGQLLNFDGNLVVIGDVNPGGEVVATGNVLVMGSLRGTVHAGADGNKEAIVVAFNLQPVQLRIADVITRSPDEKGAKNIMIPELAFVKEDMVYIERFLPQR